MWLVACGGAEIPEPDAGPPPPPETIGPSERPARFYSPPAHDGTTALPLVLLLHGYMVDATGQDLYLGTTRHARTQGFYLILPDGTYDATGERHWDVLSAEVDDHAYLRALIEEAMSLVPIGPVYVVGHSNGGSMAYRLACDSGDLITGIASLAGPQVFADCAPTDDASILHIHGTADDIVLIGGGSILGYTYPAATEVIATWASQLGCTGTQMGTDLDLVSSIDGAETTVLDHTGCRAGVALWTMEGAGHIPALTSAFTPTVLEWLRAH
jgi:polyhydroxybutyrate depolymerase